MQLLNEAALRKPTFEDGVKLTLSDGQEWTVPKPRFSLYPKFSGDGRVEAGSKVTFGREIDYFLDDLDNKDDDPLVDIRRRFDIMVKLLRSNYELTNEDLGRLLEMNRTEPESATMWKAIDRMLIGQPQEVDEHPKPSADGSE